MNTARGGAEPTAPQKMSKTKRNSNIDVLDTKTFSQTAPPVKNEDPATPDYSVYLSTEAADSPLHGIYAVYPLRVPKGGHTTGKQPCGIDGQIKGGVYNFTHTAEEVMRVFASQARRRSVVTSVRNFLVSKAKTAEDADYLRNVEITLCLGRVYSVDDGIMALDFDGYHPPADVSNGAGYREVSSSGTGEHILIRVEKELFPTGNNKIKRVIDGHDTELFYGKGNGMAISGIEASAGDSLELDPESDAGKMVISLISENSEKEPQKGTAPTGEIIPPTEEEWKDHLRRYQPLIDSITALVKNWQPQAGPMQATDDASKHMMSVCNFICGQLIDGGYPLRAQNEFTSRVVKMLLLCSSVWSMYYADGTHEVHDEKIQITIKKAIEWILKQPRATSSGVVEGERYTDRIVLDYIPRVKGWEYDAALKATEALANRQPLSDFADCGGNVYAVREDVPSGGLWCILTGPEDPVFARWCGRTFWMQGATPEIGVNPIGVLPEFQTAVWKIITVQRRAGEMHMLDCSAALTCIPTMDGYISLNTGERVENPPIYEYQPFCLLLRTADAVYDPDYQPRGRLIPDLSTYLGADTLRYLISLIAASIRQIPANRRVTVLTGNPRSSKTTLGKVLGLLGLAPSPQVDFSSEVDGCGRFRPNLMTYIGRYPMLFVNDPKAPDGNAVKKFCDSSQLYERKYADAVTVIQRASVVLTVNHAPELQTSAMDAKIMYCHSERSYIGKEIPEADYMATIRSDGSLIDLWQLIIQRVVKDQGIVIPDTVAEYNETMHSRLDALNRWLGACKQGKNPVPAHGVYLDYMKFQNPDCDPFYVIDTCNLHAKQANWRPRTGLTGAPKSKVFTELISRGFRKCTIHGERFFNIILPSWSSPSQRGEQEDRKLLTPAEAWELVSLRAAQVPLFESGCISGASQVHLRCTQQNGESEIENVKEGESEDFEKMLGASKSAAETNDLAGTTPHAAGNGVEGGTQGASNKSFSMYHYLDHYTGLKNRDKESFVRCTQTDFCGESEKNSAVFSRYSLPCGLDLDAPEMHPDPNQNTEILDSDTKNEADNSPEMPSQYPVSEMHPRCTHANRTPRGNRCRRVGRC